MLQLQLHVKRKVLATEQIFPLPFLEITITLHFINELINIDEKEKEKYLQPKKIEKI